MATTDLIVGARPTGDVDQQVADNDVPEQRLGLARLIAG
jgi:hypothetical protein